MKIFLNANEIRFLAKLMQIPAKELFQFRCDTMQAESDATAVQSLLKKHAFQSAGALLIAQEVAKMFQLWVGYTHSIQLVTEGNYSIQAVFDEKDVLLFSNKDNEYVFEFEPLTPQIRANAIEAVAQLAQKKCGNPFVTTVSKTELDACLHASNIIKQTQIQVVAERTGLAVGELERFFKIIAHENDNSCAVITHARAERLHAFVKIVPMAEAYYTLKLYDYDPHERAVLVKGSTAYVCDSIMNF